MNDPPVFPPQYRAAPVATCPDCDSDLEHAGLDEYWCRSCKQTYYFTQVVLCEGDTDD
jgi:tRNA(Ile2) C34 agmatinyltransferase TiaS